MKSKRHQQYVKDIMWNFRLLEDKEYDKIHSDSKEDSAITQWSNRLVDFRKSKFTRGTIRHELIHVYVFSCLIESQTDTSADDREEMIATIMDYHYHDYAKLTDDIWEALK